jgi:hypothetical protein
MCIPQMSRYGDTEDSRCHGPVTDRSGEEGEETKYTVIWCAPGGLAALEVPGP